MRLIRPTLLLAFAVFFTSIELIVSSQSSSQSSHASTYYSSGGAHTHSRAGPSHSESEQLGESGSSRAIERRRHPVQSPPEGGQEATSRYAGSTTRIRQQSGARHSSGLNLERSRTSTSSSSRGRPFSRSRSPATERYPNSPRLNQLPPGQLPSEQFLPNEAAQPHYQQGHFSNSESSHSSYESAASSLSSSFMSTPSHTYSPSGPYSFQYNSPSEGSESDGSNHGSPARNP